ncbi:hypothetical protein HAX54_036016, partial [Datura stramonium]|nr:hypothetical protein [Datura stramonium]
LPQGYHNSRATSMNSKMEDKRLLVPLEERLSIETLRSILMNFDGDDVQGYTDMVNGIE